jgi:HSP20 family protein
MSNFTIDIEKQLSKLGKDIQQFVEKVAPINVDTGDFHPACDIAESDGLFTVLIDLPGMKKKQIKITLKDRVITISGERELYLEDGEELKRSERKQGSFSRSFALPENADTSTISASFKEGVLQIKISKKGVEEDSESQSIPIK